MGVESEHQIADMSGRYGRLVVFKTWDGEAWSYMLSPNHPAFEELWGWDRLTERFKTWRQAFDAALEWERSVGAPKCLPNPAVRKGSTSWLDEQRQGVAWR